jgi:hypothetical protein
MTPEISPVEKYVCPVCKEEMEHDLMVFLKHTDHHIIDVILKEHPKWAQGSGICPECLDYYKKSMGHTAYMDEAPDPGRIDG